MPTPRRAALAALVLPLVTALAACSGSKPEATQDSPEDVLAAAKQALDDTAGVQVEMSTDDLPDGVDGLEKADGYANHQPAFDGTITIIALGGASLDVPVRAVDGKVYADIALLGVGWRTLDPDDYGAPDPAELLDPDTGMSSLLTDTEDPTEGDTVRGGVDNKETFTEYTGTVPADSVTTIIPTASGDAFDATYRIDGDGRVREATLTGQFYPDGDENTYSIRLDDYGTEQDVTAP